MDLARAVGLELGIELGKALDLVRHCLGQLDQAQVWARPEGGLNSIGNLLLHLTGNVRQWLIAGLTGTLDDRDRPAEFAAREAVPKEELLANLETAIVAARAALAACSEGEWLRVRRIQGFDITGLSAAINSVAHFRGHAQEIVHLTRAMLGERYRFAWVPATREEGAPA